MLLRARGRSGRRLACVINFRAALQSSRRSREQAKGSGGWGLTPLVQTAVAESDSGPRLSPSVAQLAPGTQGPALAHLEGEASCSLSLVRAGEAAERDACRQPQPILGGKKAQPERWHPAFLLFQPPLCRRPCCLQALGAATEKGTCFDRCVADFLPD